MSIPSKYAIAKHWALRWKELYSTYGKCFHIDLGEPTCMACDKSWGGKYDVNSPTATDAECSAAWDKAPMHRCHMLAKQFGGSDDVSNLLVLCEGCHAESPDIDSPLAAPMLLKWALTKENWMATSFRNVEAMLALAGVSLNDACNVWLNDRKTVMSKVGLHGGGISPTSTGAAIAARALELKHLTIH